MDKLQALRRKLKKEQEDKQEEKNADMPAAQLGYDRQPQQGQNGSQNAQKQEQQPQQIKEAIQQQKLSEPSKIQQLGYVVTPKAEKPQPAFQQHKFEGQLSPLKRQAAEPQSMASDSNYGYQNVSQNPPVDFSPKPQITSESAQKSQIVHSQKLPQQSSQASRLGYDQHIFTTPVKQSLLETQVAPQSTEEKKKSKIEMLREKMRLKKLTEQQNLSSNSIPEPPQQNSNQTQSLGYKGLSEVQNQEDNHGGKKAHTDPVKEAVLLQGIREDHIPVVALIENSQIQEQPNPKPNQQSNQPQNIKKPISPQKPLAIQSHHTLFYRLNELDDYLKAQKNLKQKPSNEQGGIKQFIEQLKLLKENIAHFNNF